MSKFAYGALFAVVLPAALAAWAMRLDRLVSPAEAGAPLPPVIGWAIAIGGALLMLAGTAALRRYGNGWPMSPYPPARRVSRGAYAVVSHPIYLGAVLVAAGVSVAMRSAAGLWIVTPVLILSCVAFVVGYERDATIERFGRPVEQPLLRFPAADDAHAVVADRLSIYLLVLLPWLIGFYSANAINAGAAARSGWSGIDTFVPIVPWTELIYILDYPLVLAVPLLLRTRRQLRDFAIDGWVAIVSVTIFYLAVPIVVVPREAPAGSIFTTLMIWERRFDTPATAFPAFHVIWAAIAAVACSRALPRLRIFWWTLASAISVSCLTTGMHAIDDVLAGIVASALILSSRRMARLLLDGAERLANSWREWDLGFVRLMSHGLYAALGSFLGILIVSILTGEPAAAVLVGVSIIVGAGLWAQFIEGSPQLLRPFGYFGGVIGCCVAIPFTPHPWLMLAAYAVAAPVIQACGRCRCLVQGCCHGRPTSEAIGIRYRHPRSRVTRLSQLASQPLHATQLYSIAWNAIVLILLLRLWLSGAPLTFIAGSYLILEGLGRFVEEHFRGEPQTKIVAGLRWYKWLSIGSVIVGAILTTLGNTPPPPISGMDPLAFLLAAGFGVLTYLAYGVDFPRLNVRFARLV
ncbi:MAG TPA: prolipoprotein diacylglyceryl transferase family protein [Thermoanaerobaculia bacterium]|nr:prolipoprotein diacylglyceryl transferase family protein [Thermoanaerobaculia bacterium]